LDIGPEERLYLKDEQWRLRQQAGIAPVLPPNDLLWLVWERVDMLAQQALLQRAMGRADVPADLEEVEPDDLRTEAKAVKKLLQQAGMSSSKARKAGVLVAMAGISDAAGMNAPAVRHGHATPGGSTVVEPSDTAPPNTRARSASGVARRYGGGMGGNGADFVSSQVTLKPPPKPTVRRRLRAADVIKLVRKEKGGEEEDGVMRARRAKKAWMDSLSTPKQADKKADSLREPEPTLAAAGISRAGGPKTPSLGASWRRSSPRRVESEKVRVSSTQQSAGASKAEDSKRSATKPRLSREHRAASRSGRVPGIPLSGRPRPRPPQAAWGRKPRPSQSKPDAARSASPRRDDSSST
jgi:hypothetical protein